MKILFEIQDLLDIIIEDVSRLGARSYSEDGTSLYDGYRITSRDEGVLSRMLEEKDVRLRELLMFCLQEEVASNSNPDTEAGNGDKEEGGEDVKKTLDYIFVDSVVSSSVARPLQVLLRKYLTDGTLYEWYTRKGIVSPITFGDIEALETKIVCLLRQGFIKKPLQPFGPRN